MSRIPTLPGRIRVPSGQLNVGSLGVGGPRATVLGAVGSSLEQFGKIQLASQINRSLAQFTNDLLIADRTSRNEASQADPTLSEATYQRRMAEFGERIQQLPRLAQGPAQEKFERYHTLGLLAVRNDSTKRANALHIAESQSAINELIGRAATGTLANQLAAQEEISNILDGLLESGAITAADKVNKEAQINTLIKAHRQAFIAGSAVESMQVALEQRRVAVSDEQREAIDDGFNQSIDSAIEQGAFTPLQGARLKTEYSSGVAADIRQAASSISRRLQDEFGAGNAPAIDTIVETEIESFPDKDRKRDLQVQARTLKQRLATAENGAELLLRWYRGEDIDERLLPRDDQSLQAFSRALQRMNADMPEAMARMAEANLPLPADFQRELQKNLSVRTLDLDTATKMLEAMERIDPERANRLLASLDNGDIGRVALEAVRGVRDEEERQAILDLLSKQSSIEAMSKSTSDEGVLRSPQTVNSPVAKTQSADELRLAFDLPVDFPISDELHSAFASAYQLEYLSLLDTPIFANANAATLDREAGARAVRRIGNTVVKIGGELVPSNRFLIGSLSSPNDEAVTQFSTELQSIEQKIDGMASLKSSVLVNFRRLVPIISRDPDVPLDDSIIGFAEWTPELQKMGTVTQKNEPQFFERAKQRILSPGRSLHPLSDLMRKAGDPDTVEVLDAISHPNDPGSSRGASIVRYVKGEWNRIYGRFPNFDDPDEREAFIDMVDEQARELGFSSFNQPSETQP